LHNDHILISGYYGFKNAGDEAILSAVVGALHKRSKKLKITVLSSNPAYTEAENPGVVAVPRMHMGKVWKAMGQADLFVFGGGGLLQDVTSFRSIYYYLGLLTMAKLRKKRIVILANGVGPVKHKLNRLFTRYVVNWADLITVRDKVSQQELYTMGVKKPVKLTADPVFLTPAAQEENSRIRRNLLDAYAQGEEKKVTIGVSLRNWHGFEHFSETLVAFFNYVNRNLPVKLLFIPMHYPGDKEALESVAERMEVKPPVVQEELHHQELQYLIGKMDLMIGMRLHALIFAAKAGVPSMGLVYDAKVGSFLEIARQASLGDVGDLDQIQMLSIFQRVFNQRNNRRQELITRAEELHTAAEENIDLIIDLLRKGE